MAYHFLYHNNYRSGTGTVIRTYSYCIWIIWCTWISGTAIAGPLQVPSEDKSVCSPAKGPILDLQNEKWRLI
jgi:hypothetical protein